MRAIDGGWDLPREPGRTTISAEGLRVDIDLRAVDQAFSRTMALSYQRAIPAEVLDKLPTT